MSTNELRMGEGTLARGAALVDEARQDFDRLGAALEGRITALHGRWAGAGGQAFFRLQSAWTEKQRVVVGALAEFEESLLGTQRDATGADDTQATLYTRNLNRLG